MSQDPQPTPIDPQQIDLERILSFFPDPKVQVEVIKAALEKGVPVADVRVDQAIAFYVDTQSPFYLDDAAQIAQRANRRERAIELYLQASHELEGHNTFVKAAEAATQAGDQDRATMLYRKAITKALDGEFCEGPQVAGDLALRIEDIDLAIQYYEAAIKSSRKKSPYDAARIALKIGDTKRAIRLLKGPWDTHVAKIYELQGDHAKAERFYKSALEGLRKERRDWLGQETLARKIGDTELLIQILLGTNEFTQAADLTPPDRAAQILEAGIAQYLQRAEDLLHEVESGNAQRQRKQALRQFEAGQIEESLRAVREVPDYQRVADELCHAAELAEKKGEQQRAKEFYTRAIGYYREGKHFKTIAPIAKKVGDTITFNWAYQRVIQEYEQREEQSCQRDREMGIPIVPIDHYHLQLAAEFALSVGEDADAIELYLRAGSNPAKLEAAEIAARIGQDQRALALYQTCEHLPKEKLEDAIRLALKVGEIDAAKGLVTKAHRRTIELSHFGDLYHIVQHALDLGQMDLVREIYDLESKRGALYLATEKASDLARLAHELGETEQEHMWRGLASLFAPQEADQINFHLLSNQEDDYNLRSTEAYIREQLHFYETKVKPLLAKRPERKWYQRVPLLKNVVK